MHREWLCRYAPKAQVLHLKGCLVNSSAADFVSIIEGLRAEKDV